MPLKAKPEEFTYLKHVTTLSQACRMYRKSRSAMMYAIDAGNVAAMQDGGVWLVSIPSLIREFGMPPLPRPKMYYT